MLLFSGFGPEEVDFYLIIPRFHLMLIINVTYLKISRFHVETSVLKIHFNTTWMVIHINHFWIWIFLTENRKILLGSRQFD